MKVAQVMDGIAYRGEIDAAALVKPVRDSREAGEGSLFFAVVGAEADGHEYAKEALEQGATAVVVQRDLGLSRQLLVEDSLAAYSTACANYFGNPAQHLHLLAVTGTDGKTTVTYLVKQLLERAGKKVGLIGSIENLIGDLSLPSRHTTPDPYQLHSLFDRMVKAGCDYVIMEVSSHAMTQRRVEGLSFAVAAFTNLSREHLDYHGTMEEYFRAKTLLFLQANKKVLNYDDTHARKLLETYPESVTFSTKDSAATLFADRITFTQEKSLFTLHQGEKSDKIQFMQPGLFSVENAMTAAGIVLMAGVPFAVITQGLNHCQGVAGRFQRIPADVPFTIIRDFAHAPGGLESLLSTVRQSATGRIITLFGCAGERDRTKRPDMAAAAARYSDVCIVTSDNPRSEDEEQILQDALPGFERYPTVPYYKIPDRLEAIRWALDFCKPGDLLIFAGKGHEDYQVLSYGTVYFDEYEIVLNIVGEAK